MTLFFQDSLGLNLAAMRHLRHRIEEETSVSFYEGATQMMKQLKLRTESEAERRKAREEKRKLERKMKKGIIA